MAYELIDFTCLNDTAQRQAVARVDVLYPYQVTMLEGLDRVVGEFDVLTAKMRKCAEDFRHLGKEWRKLSRPRGKQARRAAFAARQRALRKAR